MNVLKVFDTPLSMKQSMYKFADDNLFNIASFDDVAGRIVLLNEHRIWFRVITNWDEAANQTAGMVFSWVEFNGVIETKAKEFIWTRIRECRS